MDDILQFGNLNQERDKSNQYRDWIIGTFVEGNPMRRADEVEVKWAFHPDKDTKYRDSVDYKTITLVVWISGKSILRFPKLDKKVVLEKEGDYVMYNESKTDHEYEAVGDSTVIVVRWPSRRISVTEEVLDLVDKDDSVIGSVTRTGAHTNPLFIHREVVVTLFTKDQEVLLQQRAMTKSHPGQWKISAAGHVTSGRDPREEGMREIKEELGIETGLEYFDKDLMQYETESKFYYNFYAILDHKPELKLDTTEVMDAKWVKIEKLEEFAKNNDYELDSYSHKKIMQIAKKVFGV